MMTSQQVLQLGKDMKAVHSALNVEANAGSAAVYYDPKIAVARVR